MNLMHLAKQITCSLLFLILLLITREAIRASDPPLPNSPVIISITFSDRLARAATGSDTWPLTWANNDHLYTTFGDGWGFDPKVNTKLSLGFSRIENGPLDFSAYNIRSPSGEHTGDSRRGKKASGMLMVDGRLYMWVRNANNEGQQCQLAWSDDQAQSWTWANWKFAEFGYCAFLNYGKNYSGARDNYVYMYSPNSPDAYNAGDEVILTRVPLNQITQRNSYEFFSGTPTDPQWSTDIANRTAVLSHPDAVNRIDPVYNPGLNRYLLTNRSGSFGSGANHFTIYDAPEPWGPWTVAYHEALTQTGNAGWGEAIRIPSKWISSDGKTFYVVYSGNDSFSLKRATITTVNASPTPTTELSPTRPPIPTPTSPGSTWVSPIFARKVE